MENIDIQIYSDILNQKADEKDKKILYVKTEEPKKEESEIVKIQKCKNCQQEECICVCSKCLTPYKERWNRKSQGIIVCHNCVLCSECKKGKFGSGNWTWRHNEDFICGSCSSKK